MQERLYGGLLLAIGAFVTYLFVWSPYADMQAGVEEVEVKFSRVILGPVALAFGLMMLALGRKAAEILGRGEFDFTWRAIVALAAIFGAGIGAYFWLEAQAAAFGYS
jgi:hypothetical protein